MCDACKDRCHYDKRVKCDVEERDCKGCFYNDSEYEISPELLAQRRPALESPTKRLNENRKGAMI
jgi:hypothetical protein